MKKFICFTLAIIMLISITGCKKTVPQADPADEVEAAPERSEGSIDFAFRLFSKVKAQNENKNILISPLSVSTAIAMAANGAGGDTLLQIESLLGCNISEYNAQSESCYENLGSQLKGANSVWFHDENIAVNEQFTKALKDIYNAEIKKTPMDSNSVNDINEWVSGKTDGMIDKILNELPPETVAILVNALAFDAKWETPYEKESVREGVFLGEDGKQNADFMHSSESVYLETDMATGFIKPYKDGKYSFIGLLPANGYDVDFVVQNMTADKYIQMLENASEEEVTVGMPMFESDFSASLKDTMKALGMENAFNLGAADFSGMGDAADNIFISEILHKTYINVDADGTKAAAATAVVAGNGAVPQQMPKSVYLDRPFVYMIIDSDTNLPVFMGTVNNIG